MSHQPRSPDERSLGDVFGRFVDERRILAGLEHPNIARLIDGGCDPLYIARRLVRMASEDIGNADPRALTLALEAWDTQHRLGSPEGELAIAHAVVYLACAAKSNAVYTAYKAATETVRQTGSLEVPVHLRNAPTRLMKDLGYGSGYRYAHDHENARHLGQITRLTTSGLVADYAVGHADIDAYHLEAFERLAALAEFRGGNTTRHTAGVGDLAAEQGGHELHPVADPEDGRALPEDVGVDLGRLGVVGAPRRAARRVRRRRSRCR